MNDYRTPLSRVRGLGSAKDGTQHFWHQRLTAIANVPLIIIFAIILIALNGASYEQTVAYLSSALGLYSHADGSGFPASIT